ncbi:MAG: pre-peptidase C-terminal domain-containing protein [Aggregatilineales bacterium]
MKRLLLIFLAGVLLLAMPVLAQSTSTIAYGDSVTGTISDAVTSEVWEFEGTAGDVVTITMIADETGTLDTRLYLYDTDAYLTDDIAIAENDDSGDTTIGTLNSRIENFALPVDGLYYIEASRFSGEGDYTLTLELSTDEPADRVLNGTDIPFTLPEGWVLDNDSNGLFTYIASNNETLQLVLGADDVLMPEGQIGMSFIAPDALSQFELAPDAPAQEVIEALIGVFESDSAAESYDILDNPAAISFLEGDSAPEQALIIAVELSVGTIVAAVQHDGDFEAAEPQVIEVLNSLGVVEDEDDAEIVQDAIVEIGDLNADPFTYEDGAVLTIASPENFLIDPNEQGYFYIANDEDMLDAIRSGSTDVMASGAFGISITLPGTFAEPLGLAEDTPALEALIFFAEAVGSTADVEEYVLVDDTAAYTELVDSFAPPNTHVIATDNEDGVVFIVVQLGPDVSFASVEGTVIDIINSIAFTPAGE